MRSGPVLALTAALLLAGGPAARADVMPTLAPNPQSLGTLMTPHCSVATCLLSISGGTQAGSNLFHRFDRFDTTSNGGSAAIDRVTFQNTPNISNIIVGVLSGSHISVPINLQNPAGLVWLSPAGITISGNGRFSNVSNLSLSTATGLRLSSSSGNGQIFDAALTDQATARELGGPPVPEATGLVTAAASLAGLNPQLTNNGAIVLQGGLLTVDQSLLLDAQGGTVQINNAKLRGLGLTIQGEGVRLSGGTQISADGSVDPLVVVAGAGPFINEAGSAVFNVNGGGRWLVYTDNPTGSSYGGLPFSFKQYGKSFADGLPIQGSGNGLLYAVTPVISASLTSVSKVYDGTAKAFLSGANLQLSGVLQDDRAAINVAGSYTSAGISPILNSLPKDVGTDKLVIANLSLASVTSSAGGVPVYGYQLNSTSLSTNTAAITPRTITPFFTAAAKVYDRTTSAQISSRTLLGRIGCDDVSLTGGHAFFTDRNVSNNKTVNASGFSLSGNAAANYTLAASSAQAIAAILPLAITPTFTAVDKTYDGNTTAQIASRSLLGTISGDDVQLAGGSAFFTDLNAGNNKVVNASGFLLFGSDAANYTLSANSAQAFASIFPLLTTSIFTASAEPPPLLPASSQANGRDRLVTNLDQAISFRPDIFTQPPARIDPAFAASISPAGWSVSTVSPGETRESFIIGMARSQQDTARRLGLAEAEQATPPSIKDLQKALQEITRRIRARQQPTSDIGRRCGTDGQQRCPS